MRKTQVNTEKNTQKIPSRVSPTKWAHLIEKTGVQSPGTDIHKMGAHQAVSKTKGGARGGTRGLAEPQGRPAPCRRRLASSLAGNLVLSTPRRCTMFPYLLRAGTDLLALYKGPPSPPLTHTTKGPFQGLSRCPKRVFCPRDRPLTHL